MNNRELIAAIALKMNLSQTEVSVFLDAFSESVMGQLRELNSVGLQGFGVFDVRRRKERVFVQPRTKAKTLLPPRQVVTFKQSNLLKEKLNQA